MNAFFLATLLLLFKNAGISKWDGILQSSRLLLLHALALPLIG
jgi:hypothetical protein